MSPSEKNDHALVAQTLKSRPRRTGSAHHYTLPKPYRHTAPPDEQPATSKSKLAMLALAGLLVAGLVAELVALVQENMRVRKLPVIAAMAPEMPAPGALVPAPLPPVPAAAPVPSRAPGLSPQESAVAGGISGESDAGPVLAGSDPQPAQAVEPELAPEPAAEGDQRGTPVPVKVAAPPRAPAGGAMTKTRRPRVPSKPAAPAPDPDVVLVTAILMLTAKPELPEQVTVCDPGIAKEATCSDMHGMTP